MAEKISLNGFWDWQLPGGMIQRKQLPSSYLCVGTAIYLRSVNLHLLSPQHAFLCFDGIAYHGQVWVNDMPVGEMLPYVPYRFDITGQIKDGTNAIRVEIQDISADYGPTGGWEDYGGITRDVFIELTGPAWIEDVHFMPLLNDALDSADCQVAVGLDGDLIGSFLHLSVSLAHNRQAIYHGEKKVSPDKNTESQSFNFSVDHPMLWSPDSPILYDLQVTLSAGSYLDEKNYKVGFREFKVAGSRFILNGKEIFLKGVARHEMWGEDQGFTLSREQILYDLTLIKQLGANFVRLVHYPHSKATIELCDQLGLLATEEPGLWWSDLTDQAITSKALAIMEKTVRRDRNSPSVVAWLLYNECVFAGAVDYLTRGKALCNSLDPGRLVSAANCLDPLEAKHVFDQAGLDFYTFHPYSYEPDRMIQGVEAMQGKPLVFTEWGGYLFVDTPNMKRWFTRVLRQYAQQHDPLPNLAGISYWQFQDINQFSRGLPGCVDGSLTEGLVDKQRVKKPMYDVMADLFKAVEDPTDPEYKVEIHGQIVSSDESIVMTPIDLSPYQASPGQRQAWQTVLDSLKVFQSIGMDKVRKSKGPEIRIPMADIGGLPVMIKGRSLILGGDCREIQIAVGAPASRIYFIGQTTFFDGYPVRGKLGDAIAHYTLQYTSGLTQTIILRNGYEMASASLIARTSRLNALAANTRRILTLHLEEDWEVYQVSLLEIKTNQNESIQSITFSSDNDQFQPLLYGITLERNRR